MNIKILTTNNDDPFNTKFDENSLTDLHLKNRCFIIRE